MPPMFWVSERTSIEPRNDTNHTAPSLEPGPYASVAFTAAQRAIDRLEAAGVVAQVGEGRRNRVYCAEAILDVLEERTDPRLSTT